jgi:hypothetical protein
MVLPLERADLVGAAARQDEAYEDCANDKYFDKYKQATVSENFQHATSPFQRYADGGTKSFWIRVMRRDSLANGTCLAEFPYIMANSHGLSTVNGR